MDLSCKVSGIFSSFPTVISRVYASRFGCSLLQANIADLSSEGHFSIAPANLSSPSRSHFTPIPSSHHSPLSYILRLLLSQQSAQLGTQIRSTSQSRSTYCPWFSERLESFRKTWHNRLVARRHGSHKCSEINQSYSNSHRVHLTTSI